MKSLCKLLVATTVMLALPTVAWSADADLSNKELRQRLGYALDRLGNQIEESRATIDHLELIRAELNRRITAAQADPDPDPEPAPDPDPDPQPQPDPGDDRGSAGAPDCSVVTADLMGALAGAGAGDTICLEAGHYGAPVLKGVTFDVDAPVTITSADPANRAVMSEISFTSGSHGLVVAGVVVHYDCGGCGGGEAINILDQSHDITVRDSEVMGTVDGNYGNNPRGFRVRPGSYNITFDHNVFHDFGKNVGHFNDVHHVAFTNNEVHTVRSDGLQISGGMTDSVIAGNTFRGFHPSDGDHPDAIQFFTTGGGEVMARVTIARNVILEDLDGRSLQAIFVADPPAGGYVDFTIEDNVIWVSAGQGIWIFRAQGSVIRNNTVLRKPGNHTPTLDTQQADVLDNVAPALSNRIETGAAGTVSGNVLLDPADYASVFVNAADPRSDDGRVTLADFMCRAAAAIDCAATGSALLAQ